MRYCRSWMSYRLFIGALMTLGLLILVSSPRIAAAQDRLADVIEKAKKEKDIVFQISEPRGKFSSAQAERMMADLVRKKFGVNLGIKFTFSLSFNAASARALSEIKAGSVPSYDLMYQVTGSGIGLYAANAIHPVPWRKHFDWISKKDLVFGDQGIIAGTLFILPSYNTNMIKPAQVPKTWEDLLMPRWKGNISTTIYQDLWLNLAQPRVWGEAKTTKFLVKLSKQEPVLGRFPEVHAKVISGEVPLAVLDISNNVNSSKAKGAPVEQAIIEPIIVSVYLVLVPKNARHPNAAMLLAASLLTQEGQEILGEGWGATSLFKEGTPAAKFVKGRKIALPDVDFEKERGLALQKEWERIIVKR